MVIGRNLVLSAAHDGVTLVEDETVVMMDVVGMVVAVTIVGISVGVSHGSACVTQAGPPGVMCVKPLGDVSVGVRFVGVNAGIEIARLPTRRFCSSLCRSSAYVPSIGRLLFSNSSFKFSLVK